MTLTAVSLSLSMSGTFVAWLIGQILLACAFVQWYVLLHECGHDTLFRTRRLNSLVGHLASFFAMLPFRSWTFVHGKHHKWTGWQDLDPTTVSLQPRELHWIERAVINFCWKCWIPLFNVIYRVENFWHLPRLLGMSSQRQQRRAFVANILILLGAYYAVIQLVGVASVIHLVGFGLLVSLMFQEILTLSQHVHVPMKRSGGETVAHHPAADQEPFTRSLMFPRWFSLGVLLQHDLHELHHMYPFVPAYHLRRIPYSPQHQAHWWRWVRSVKGISGEVFLFRTYLESGLEI